MKREQDLCSTCCLLGEGHGSWGTAVPEGLTDTSVSQDDPSGGGAPAGHCAGRGLQGKPGCTWLGFRREISLPLGPLATVFLHGLS